MAVNTQTISNMPMSVEQQQQLLPKSFRQENKKKPAQPDFIRQFYSQYIMKYEYSNWILEIEIEKQKLFLILISGKHYRINDEKKKLFILNLGK